MLLRIPFFLFCTAFPFPVLPAYSQGPCPFTNSANSPEFLASETALLKVKHQKPSCYSWLQEQIVVQWLQAPWPAETHPCLGHLQDTNHGCLVARAQISNPRANKSVASTEVGTRSNCFTRFSCRRVTTRIVEGPNLGFPFKRLCSKQLRCSFGTQRSASCSKSCSKYSQVSQQSSGLLPPQSLNTWLSMLKGVSCSTGAVNETTADVALPGPTSFHSLFPCLDCGKVKILYYHQENSYSKGQNHTLYDN